MSFPIPISTYWSHTSCTLEGRQMWEENLCTACCVKGPPLGRNKVSSYHASCVTNSCIYCMHLYLWLCLPLSAMHFTLSLFYVDISRTFCLPYFLFFFLPFHQYWESARERVRGSLNLSKADLTSAFFVHPYCIPHLFFKWDLECQGGCK